MRPWLVAMVLLAAACSGSPSGSPNNVATDVMLPDGLEATVHATGLVGPTQMVFADDGDLIVAELNGAENDATGRILRIDAEDPDQRTVLQEGLDKPTGVVVAGEQLWIMERQRLSVTSLEPGAGRVVVADEMPFNGRSQGTLTLLPDGTLLYNTSGSKRGPERADGSGMIFAIGDAASTDYGVPTVIAEGFKHAYAHVLDGDGQLWSVEMTDGNFDDERASDELLAISVGDDAGWPQCVDDNRPVIEFGGDQALCDQSPRSHALFGPGATPTSFVVSPWNGDEFIVALWLPSQVVTVPRTAPGAGPHEPTIFMTGFESPQHLLVGGDQLFVSDHETGQIVVVTSAN